jgi:RimJ/RimL family protein N-acetyltransferase
MPDFPTLGTPRLVLRPFTELDATDVQRLAGDARVADTTLTIPHPYPDGAAEAWIATHEGTWNLGRSLTLAVTLRDTGELIGAIGLSIDPDKRSAEMGYWVGVPFWGSGYCTEAARAVLQHGFAALDLLRIHAHAFARNPASARVMEKIGMLEGVPRQKTVLKNGRPEEVREFAISRAAWDARTGLGSA